VGDLTVQVAREQTHQDEYLRRRPLPVVGGEGVQRQRGDAEVRSGCDDAAHGFGAGAMAGTAWQAAARGPAAVAVHDDRDV